MNNPQSMQPFNVPSTGSRTTHGLYELIESESAKDPLVFGRLCVCDLEGQFTDSKLKV